MGSPLKVSLREYGEEIEEAYRRLFPADEDKGPELLRWRFLDNPHGSARFAVGEDGQRIVGMIALFATRLRNAPGRGLAYQAIDTSVDPAFRGRGLFVQMGALAQAPSALGGELLWGFPNANAAPGWYGRLGWTHFGEVPLLMRPLRSSYFFARVHARLRGIDFSLVRGGKRTGQVYDDGTQFAEDVDQLWTRVAPGLGIVVDRTGEWMRWRLFEKPAASYRCVGLKGEAERLDAFVAIKIADKHGGRLCYVMEALASPDHNPRLASLLRAELSHAADSGAELALAWCPQTAPNYAAYRKAGFLPMPARFRPIHINFGAKSLIPQSAEAAARNARWYVSYLDSDTN